MNKDDRPKTQIIRPKNETIIIDGELKRNPISKPGDSDDSALGSKSQMMLFILGMVERIDFAKHPVITLGRFDERARADDELNLEGYGAVERGVSRLHCQLELVDNKVVVTDLDSSNGTFVSGKRLEPHQPHTMQKGEELVLGRLPIQIISGR